MTKLDYLAEEIKYNLEKESREFDPLTVIAIISLLISLYRLYRECKKTDDQIIASIKRPNIFEKRILRQEIKKLLKTIKHTKTKAFETNFMWSLKNCDDAYITDILKECKKQTGV